LGVLSLSFPSALRAALQFDVFLGYDGIVPEASWFPIVCEVKNDGPPFKGVIEVSMPNYGEEQSRLLPVELPTGTLKRFVIPVFSTTRNYTAWNVRLLDERRRVRAEQPNIRPNKQVAADVPVLGALSRSAAGAPVIRQLPTQQYQQAELQPVTARLQPQVFPDNPLVLEGLRAIYLSSERAPQLRDTQVAAIMGWLNEGGHLIVGVDQLTDVNGTPWLKNLLPVELNDLQPVKQHPGLQEWLRGTPLPSSLATAKSATAQLPGNVRYGVRQGKRVVITNAPPIRAPQPAPVGAPQGATGGNPYDEPADPAFEGMEMPVAGGKILDGTIDAGTPETPLMVSAMRGRGCVTVLLFSPEREPFHSWKNQPSFWARMLDVPAEWYGGPKQNNRFGGLSSDAVFGAMIDSRQVHKLPVEWLLLLLVVYLIVIGPLDQYWLKRIGRPMLTWITFPCYVIFFSLLIYFIGYKLRAGESEWNELHLVDVLPNGDHAELRGRTYASVYSPSNQRYNLESRQKFSTLRGEFAGMMMGGQSSERATVVQNGDSFKAEVLIPVWTCQVFVNDWWQSAPMPLTTTLVSTTNGWSLTVDNQTGKPLSDTHLVVHNHLVRIGDFKAGERRTVEVAKGEGRPLRDFLNQHAGPFRSAVEGRRQIFGSTERARIDDVSNSVMAASFLGQFEVGPNNYGQGQFLCPPGLDATPLLDHGGAMFFAYEPGLSPVKSILQFTPKRFHQSTMWRVPLAVQ